MFLYNSQPIQKLYQGSSIVDKIISNNTDVYRDEEATILYDAAGNEIERVYGNISSSQFYLREDIVSVVGGTSTTAIGAYAFAWCDNLVSISFPSVTFASLGAFVNCDNLNSVNLPEMTTAGTSLFESCSSLVSITLPKLDFLPIYAFMFCFNLTTVTLPRVVNGIDPTAFILCRNLTTISLDSLKEYAADGDIFSTTNLTTIILRPAPNTPADWTLGPGQTIGGKSGITVVANWTDWPN